MEVDLNKFHGDTSGLHEALKIAARTNYRQTCVDFRDGILQESWHLNNEFLRLCGVGLTGIATRPDLSDYDYSEMERVTTFAAYSMADELGLQRPKNVTCVKPSGSLSKIMDTTEGVHKPLGKYIFNNVTFGKYDPLVEKLRKANYNIINHPSDATAVVITFPVKWDSVEFDIVDGIEVNLETAIEQLERYKMVQNSWCHQNLSNTISYSVDEVPAIIDWMLDNWESYIGVSFLYRADPTKTAKDLGYLYLPQEVVTKETWESYAKTLLDVDVEGVVGFDEIEQDVCATGACPIR
jgi:ribonucleoside-triphosphate reductase